MGGLERPLGTIVERLGPDQVRAPAWRADGGAAQAPLYLGGRVRSLAAPAPGALRGARRAGAHLGRAGARRGHAIPGVGVDRRPGVLGEHLPGPRLAPP